MTTNPDLDDYRWLTSDAALPWLQRAAVHAGELTSLASKLRRDLGPARTHLVLELTELRQRATAKFSQANKLLFTRRGLEQASSEQVANYKAARFPRGQAVLDLCCGIGGDLMSLAGRGPSMGIERCESTALVARYNCRALEHDETQVLAANAEEATVGECSQWHIDPDRRPDARRTTHVELYEPNLRVLDRLLAQSQNAAIKLAPATVAPEHWSAQAELEWIGERGECRQQMAWFGQLAVRPGNRSATILTPGEAPWTISDRGDPELPPADAVGRFLFEPHAAVLAAGLSGAVAARHGLASITPHGGYLTGDSTLAERSVATFEVTGVLPFDMKRVKNWLRQRGIGRLEVKKRGLTVDPREIRHALRTGGDNAATLILTRLAGQAVAILANRLSPR